ncbi:chalcone domain-containing protein [Ceratobasidium sp. AG-Ba]|nr:chalcone domain-containing protein [Ceratobasidium sp. AG-Ba]QRW14912.1 chalcone domain-containing protein [Ceratobasidium sp. AG-Ba]
MLGLSRCVNARTHVNLPKGSFLKRHPKKLGSEGYGKILVIQRLSRFTSSGRTLVNSNTGRTQGNVTRSLTAYGIIVGGLAFQFWLLTQSYALDAPELTVDPATSIKFPTRLKLDGESELTLLGVGVRTVSFLSIRVYSVGFYADLTNIDLKSLELCKDAEERIETLLKTTTFPTRATSYSHLRDGFIRAIQARQALARKAGKLEVEHEEALHAPLQQFKGLFPTAAFKKHEPMHIVLSSPKTQPRQLRIPPLGTVKDTWIATEFFRAYFQGTISPPLIEDVKRGVDGII